MKRIQVVTSSMSIQLHTYWWVQDMIVFTPEYLGLKGTICYRHFFYPHSVEPISFLITLWWIVICSHQYVSSKVSKASLMMQVIQMGGPQLKERKWSYKASHHLWIWPIVFCNPFLSCNLKAVRALCTCEPKESLFKINIEMSVSPKKKKSTVKSVT